jgi:hypothetical protein
VWSLFAEDGSMHDPDACSAAVKTMLDELLWFARALGRARADEPYGS